MTVLELYNLALALLNEVDTEAKDYPKLKVPYINLLLAQCFTTENWIRTRKGEAVLVNIPAVQKDSDSIPYDAAYTQECLPYLLPSMLAVDEDRDLANVYSRMYAQLADKYLTVFAEQMNDVYREAEQ